MPYSSAQLQCLQTANQLALILWAAHLSQLFMRTANTPSSPKQYAVIQPAITAFKAYWPAIVFVQSCALGAVISYYTIDTVTQSFSRIAEWKESGGLLFAAITTMISGGILPELLKRCFLSKGRKAPSGIEFTHQLVMWGALGMLVERFYHLQGILFGTETSATTSLIKVAFDLLLFTPFISLPGIVLWMSLFEHNYKVKTWLKEALRFPSLRERVLPLWATSLCFWPITLLIIYSLPSPLQFPLFLFGNAAFSILMIFIVRHQN